jgi:spore germination protein GerM
MKKFILLVGFTGTVLTISGCGHHPPAHISAMPDQTPPQAPAAPNAPSSPTISAGPSASSASATAPAPRQAVIYTVNDVQGTHADNYLVPSKIALSDPTDPARETVQALLTAKNTPFAAGVKLDHIKITHGLATVDFSQSPVDEYHGEESQSQALESLQMTLGQFPEIHQILITVKGKTPAAIGEAAGGPMDVVPPGKNLQELGGA